MGTAPVDMNSILNSINPLPSSAPTSGIPVNWGQVGSLGSALSMIPAAAFPTTGSSSGTTTSNLNTNQNLTGTTTGNTSSTSGYGAAGTATIAQLMPMLSQLSQNTNLQPYQAQQTEGINNTANAATANANADLAARGLSRSPAAATSIANIGAQRTGAITNLNQQIPLLQNQLTSSNAGTIAGILSQLPKTGTTATSGTTGQTGTTSQTGNTTQNVNTSQGGGAAGLFGGIGSALASLF